MLLVNRVSHLIAFGCARSAEGVMSPASIRHNGEKHISFRGNQFGSRRQVNASLFPDRILRTIAVRPIAGIVEKCVYRLIAFQVDNPKSLPGFDLVHPAFARW